ncbi:hypothetical protein RDWZM_003246 [Blomia tropicalis]|uniref:Uncharacterized protein n=1 Tax=Blomia tropicalis TaxID=40697 RepID=A0A9Q0MEV8_BLOTA|nr:hypothetical protein RDWZM_003246 [Blomia tropicalis]
MDLLNESSTTMATTTMMFNTATTTLSSADSVYSDQPNMTTSILIDLMTTTTLGTTMTTNNGTSLISASTISPSTMTTTINSIRMNMTTNYPRVTSFSPAIIHFTYYELNFFDIIFIACIFFLKFFITSLFIIFALVSINGNSYPQLLQRATESYRMSFVSNVNRLNGSEYRRKDLLFTVAALNIISGNLRALLDYLSAVQRFIYVNNCAEKWKLIKKFISKLIRWFRWRCGLSPSSSSSHDGFMIGSKVIDSRAATPTVIFIDSEPALPPPIPPLVIKYRPTLKIRVKNTIDGTSALVRTLIDPQSACSYISEQVVTNLRMRKYFIWPCFFQCSPGMPTQYVFQATCVTLQSMEQDRREPDRIPFSVDNIELLVPTSRVSYGIVPKPSKRLQSIAKEMCDITLSEVDGDDPSLNTSPDQEIGLVIGQDLLYRLFLTNSEHEQHEAFMINRDMCFVKTTFGWTAHGSINENDYTEENQCIGQLGNVLRFETKLLGINEYDSTNSKRKCTDTMRILCCPIQILVSLLVLIIYIIIPYIDALIYLYNILFHFAIAFALIQIVALVLGPILSLFQSIAHRRLSDISFHRIKSNIIRINQVLSHPLILIYRWFLGGVWIALYWFLSMGKALFNQWNYSNLESDYGVRFSAHFTLKLPASFPDDETIHVRFDPTVDQSSINFQWTNTWEPGLTEKIVFGNDVRMRREGSQIVVRFDGNDNAEEIRFVIADHSIDGSSSSSDPHIIIGCDLIHRTSMNNPIGTMTRRIYLFRDLNAIQRRRMKQTVELISEPDSSWTLEHRFYPHGWQLVLTCTYWFNRTNFIYLIYFLLYSFLLAVVYAYLIVPYELTLISIHPTMFRYIGNFIFFSTRLGR